MRPRVGASLAKPDSRADRLVELMDLLLEVKTHASHGKRGEAVRVACLPGSFHSRPLSRPANPGNSSFLRFSPVGRLWARNSAKNRRLGTCRKGRGFTYREVAPQGFMRWDILANEWVCWVNEFDWHRINPNSAVQSYHGSPGWHRYGRLRMKWPLGPIHPQGERLEIL